MKNNILNPKTVDDIFLDSYRKPSGIIDYKELGKLKRNSNAYKFLERQQKTRKTDVYELKDGSNDHIMIDENHQLKKEDRLFEDLKVIKEELPDDLKNIKREFHYNEYGEILD